MNDEEIRLFVLFILWRCLCLELHVCNVVAWFLGAFVKMQKRTVSFVMSV